MDDTEKQPAPPRPDEVESLQAQSPPSATPLHEGETRPSRPGGVQPSASVLPPPDEHPAAGQTPPPAPGGTTTATNIQAAEMTPGLERSIESSNLDAVAQSDPTSTPDRESAEALQNIVEGGTLPVPLHEINRAL